MRRAVESMGRGALRRSRDWRRRASCSGSSVGASSFVYLTRVERRARLLVNLTGRASLGVLDGTLPSARGLAPRLHVRDARDECARPASFPARGSGPGTGHRHPRSGPRGLRTIRQPWGGGGDDTVTPSPSARATSRRRRQRGPRAGVRPPPPGCPLRAAAEAVDSPPAMCRGI